MAQFIKLSKWAKLNDYSYRGAYGLFKAGGIPKSKQMRSGTILVEVEPEKPSLHFPVPEPPE